MVLADENAKVALNLFFFFFRAQRTATKAFLLGYKKGMDLLVVCQRLKAIRVLITQNKLTPSQNP